MDELPDFSRVAFVSRMRATVESVLGVPFSDALNLALFGLTIVSLVTASIGVYIANKTLKDTRQSGDVQERILEDSRNALEASTASLNKVLGLTAEQQKRLEKQIEIGNTQQNLLSEDVRTAKSQLDIVREEYAQQVDIANRRPDIEFGLLCPGLDLSRNIRTFDGPKATMEVGPDGKSYCFLNLRNKGSEVLRKAHLSVEAFSEDGQIELKFVKSVYDPKGTAQPTTSEQALISGDDFYPQSINSDSPEFTFYVNLPQKIDSLELELRLWGENYRDTISHVRIDVKR